MFSFVILKFYKSFSLKQIRSTINLKSSTFCTWLWNSEWNQYFEVCLYVAWHTNTGSEKILKVNYATNQRWLWALLNIDFHSWQPCAPWSLSISRERNRFHTLLSTAFPNLFLLELAHFIEGKLALLVNSISLLVFFLLIFLWLHFKYLVWATLPQSLFQTVGFAFQI